MIPARAVIRDAQSLLGAEPLFQRQVEILVARIGKMRAHGKDIKRRLGRCRPKDLHPRTKWNGGWRRNGEDRARADGIKNRAGENRVRVAAVIHQLVERLRIEVQSPAATERAIAAQSQGKRGPRSEINIVWLIFAGKARSTDQHQPGVRKEVTQPPLFLRGHGERIVAQSERHLQSRPKLPAVFNECRPTALPEVA